MLPPFDRLVTIHGEAVLRVCRSIAGPDAEDAWSETFLSALRAYPSLRTDSNIEAWLVTIARNKSLDICRRRSRDIPVLEVPEIPVEFEPDNTAIWHQVAQLPTKQRTALTYRYLGGLPYQDIADLVGGTPAAARRNVADAVKSLRQEYLS